MTKEEYAKAVLKTAINNGMTKEEILNASVEELTKAHLDSQMAFYDEVERRAKEDPKFIESLLELS